MAFVMALQQGWSPTALRFQGTWSSATGHTLSKYATPVNNDIKGLIDSVNDGSTSAFMWEWFTTKPWLDSGEVRFVRTPTVKISQYMLKLAWSDRLRSHTVAIVVDCCTPISRACSKGCRSRLLKLAH